MSHELIVFVTVPSQEVSSRIARVLVSERLAACVNVVSGVSAVAATRQLARRQLTWLRARDGLVHGLHR